MDIFVAFVAKKLWKYVLLHSHRNDAARRAKTATQKLSRQAKMPDKGMFVCTQIYLSCR
jgi:hypothetical protein